VESHDGADYGGSVEFCGIWLGAEEQFGTLKFVQIQFVGELNGLIPEILIEFVGNVIDLELY
jgi:hypothetical protein